MRGTSFLGVSGLSLGCGFKRVYGKYDLGIDTVIRGMFYVAGCDNMSPRIPGKISGSFCPHPHAFSLGMNFGFWLLLGADRS